MKHLVYIFSLILLSFTACNEDFNDGVYPQTNPQEDAQTFEGLTIALNNTFKNNLDLSTYKATDSINVVDTQATPKLNSRAVMEYVLQLSNTADFTTFATLNVGDGNDVTVDELNTAFRSVFGLSPKQRDVYVRVKAYIAEGTSRIAYGDFFNFGSVKITPVPYSVTIEDAYYLLTNTGSGWNVSEMKVFNHSSSDVYDDPVFSLRFEAPANNTKLLIVPASLVDQVKANNLDGVFGSAIDSNTATAGDLTSASAGSILIEEAQWVNLTLNMLTRKYTVELLGQASPYLYVPGNQQGWSPASATKLYSAGMNMIYTGYSYLDGEFKLTTAPDWSHSNYGVKDGLLSTSGDNLSVTEAGFYYIYANLNNLKYTVTKTVWGLIGDATPKGWDASTPMTYNATDNSWSATVSLTAGTFKFRANDAWDLNMGGTLNNLTQNGANITVADAGTYLVKLYLTNDESSYCTLTKQ